MLFCRHYFWTLFTFFNQSLLTSAILPFPLFCLLYGSNWSQSIGFVYWQALLSSFVFFLTLLLSVFSLNRAQLTKSRKAWLAVQRDADQTEMIFVKILKLKKAKMFCVDPITGVLQHTHLQCQDWWFFNVISLGSSHLLVSLAIFVLHALV